MNVNGEIAILSLIYLTEPLSFDFTHKFASLSQFGNNFTIKLKNLYCVSMTYEDIVRFGGDSQVCAVRREALLCHRRCCGCGRCDQRLHRHEQRGTGREKYLSPPKLVRKDKKGSDK